MPVMTHWVEAWEEDGKAAVVIVVVAVMVMVVVVDVECVGR
jgi:hypothetical protein